jgi:c-di-GMP-binding flagellar brake protein YcgR
MLAEVLSEFEAAAAAGAKKKAAEEQARVEAEMRALTPVTELPQPRQLQEKPAKSERRAQLRHEVYDSAVIYLINVGCSLNGHILDLSLGGCRIRTDERFPVGIHIRIETEFWSAGIPFRLGGVIQAIHDQHNVGIRFLDMSDRKREQVEQLIEEIQEEQARRKLADEGNLGEEGHQEHCISEDGAAGD